MTNDSESTTKPHWTNERADAAVQATIEARALVLATARALGLADEDVERLPQVAAQVRAILATILDGTDAEPAADAVRLAQQVRARTRVLQADLGTLWGEMAEDDEATTAAREALLATGVEPASNDLAQLAVQVVGLVRRLRAGLEEIRDEAADTNLDVIWTAANGALDGGSG